MSNIHPRPDFMRRQWQSLNGEWEFEFDKEDKGLREKWFLKHKFTKKIIVPFVYECKASGITGTEAADTVWYKRVFDSDTGVENIRLNFGAVDYEATVWLNGFCLGTHTGGYTPFGFKASDYLNKTDNVLVVRAHDTRGREQPRGKQTCNEKPDRCWYGGSTGIWQSVWLEKTGGIEIAAAYVTPDIKQRNIKVELVVENYKEGTEAAFTVSYNGTDVKRLRTNLNCKNNIITIDMAEPDYVDELHYWSPRNPQLYDLKIQLIYDGAEADTVETYFGMRNIEIINGRIMFNNSPLYQKLVLHQGYFEDSLLSAKSDEDFRRDIEMIKEYGFNGVRMHQKIEDPRFYYWADKLGLLVWAELPSAYQFCNNEIENYIRDMTEFIKRDYNHPSIVVWVPLNESWGVRNIRYDGRQQDLAMALYHTVKAFDNTRLVTANDGWEIAGGDFTAVHNYEIGDGFSDNLSDTDNYKNGSVNYFRNCLADGVNMDGKPVILSEYGGIAFNSDGGWGYSGAVNGTEEFIERFSRLQKHIYSNKLLQGFCYTQWTDVFQETNGLLKMSREVKVPAAAIKKYIEGKF